jgi:hypothetical protein
MATAALPLEVPMLSKEETSLSSKAMLSKVSISAWSGYKFDREASEQIAEIHGAERIPTGSTSDWFPARSLRRSPRSSAGGS